MHGNDAGGAAVDEGVVGVTPGGAEDAGAARQQRVVEQVEAQLARALDGQDGALVDESSGAGIHRIAGEAIGASSVFAADGFRGGEAGGLGAGEVRERQEQKNNLRQFSHRHSVFHPESVPEDLVKEAGAKAARTAVSRPWEGVLDRYRLGGVDGRQPPVHIVVLALNGGEELAL